MITIFNRKELCNVFSMKEQSNIQDILAKNNIEYKVKAVNRMAYSPFASSRRSRTGSFGVDVNYTYEYKFYVHQKDYDRALYVIGR